MSPLALQVAMMNTVDEDVKNQTESFVTETLFNSESKEEEESVTEQKLNETSAFDLQSAINNTFNNYQFLLYN